MFLVAIGLGAALVLTTTAGPTTTFMIQPANKIYPAIWAVDTGRIAFPDDIKPVVLKDLPHPYDENPVAWGTMDTGFWPLHATGIVIRENPDLVLNGYGIYHAPADGIYTSDHTNISRLADLEGKTVAGNTHGSGILLLKIFLAERGIENVTFVQDNWPKPELDAGTYDAAHIQGDIPGQEPLIQPRQRWEARHGARLPTVLWWSNGRTHLENSVEAAARFQEAIRVGYANVDRLNRTIRRSFPRNDMTRIWAPLGRMTVIRLTEQDLDMIQRTVDAAHRHGVFPDYFRVRDLLVRPDADR